MAKRILNIVDSAHRATLEEQDDTVLWLVHALHDAGADLTVVLRGNAATYAVRGHDAAGLAFGDRRQTNPPRPDDDVAKLVAKGVGVLIIGEDLAARGIERAELVDGVAVVPRLELAALIAAHDQVWHW